MAAEVVQLTKTGVIRLQDRLRDIPVKHADGMIGRGQLIARFKAVITGNADYGDDGVRWKYAWRALLLSGDLLNVIGDGAWNGLSGTLDEFFALNDDEITNEAEPDDDEPWILAGVDVHGSSYPSGFALRPIGGGGTDNTHKKDTVVTIEIWQSDDGKVTPWFDKRNSHDGTCDS